MSWGSLVGEWGSGPRNHLGDRVLDWKRRLNFLWGKSWFTSSLIQIYSNHHRIEKSASDIFHRDLTRRTSWGLIPVDVLTPVISRAGLVQSFLRWTKPLTGLGTDVPFWGIWLVSHHQNRHICWRLYHILYISPIVGWCDCHWDINPNPSNPWLTSPGMSPASSLLISTFRRK